MEAINNSDEFHCFFCLSSQDSQSDKIYLNEANNQSIFHKLLFRNLSRYLHLFRFSKFCDLKENSISYLSWSICKQCSQMAVKFNELFHLLEATKLQLTGCLERMHQVMTAKTPNDAMDTFRASILDQIEETTKPLPLPYPRVLLHKIKNLPENRCQSHSSSSSSDNEMDLDDPINSPSPLPELPVTVSPFETIKIKNEHADADLNQTGRLSEREKPLQEAIRAKRKKKPVLISPLQLQCSFCRASFDNRDNDKYYGERVLHQHVARYHCDQLFPNHRLENISVPQFKKILATLIWKDLISEDKDTICCYCNKRFPKPKKNVKPALYVSKVKGHFIQAHYEEIEKNLKRFQSNPDVSKILMECDSSAETICDCGVYLENLSVKIAHKKFHCPLTSKSDQEDKPDFEGGNDAILRANFHFTKNSPDKLVCKSCKETFATRRNAVRHWKYYCRKGKRLKVPEKASLSCEYCSYKCVDRLWNSKSRMKYHHVRLHPEHFFKEERDLLHESKWKKKNFKDILANIMFPKLFSRVGKTNTKCSLCGQMYKNQLYHSNVNMVKTHLINNHMYNLKQKLKDILEESNQSLSEQLDGHFEDVRGTEMDEGTESLKCNKGELCSDKGNESN